MKKIDAIIGYEAIKKELEQIADIFKNKEKYGKFGVKPPKGVLIHGVPGVGKTLMANTLIDEIALKSFVCRKDRPADELIRHIKRVFAEATDSSSVIFLDDMDKFANGDVLHKDSEEYVTIQSCIDEVKNKNVLVIATANCLECLPPSLLRAGRFDRVIEVKPPNAVDAERIIKHYLAGKKISEELDFSSIVKIMSNHSCAELETIINEAGIYAGFENSEYIEMPHFLKAAMRTVFDVPASAFEEGATDKIHPSDLLKVVYHEAGHVLVHEILDPGSVSIVSVFGSGTESLGGRTEFNWGSDIDSDAKYKGEIIAALAGMAAVELKFGISDKGCSSDLEKAFDLARESIINLCSSGIHLHGEYGDFSNELRLMQEQAVVAEVEKGYRKAKEIIATNICFFEGIVKELSDKKILCSKDIENIRKSNI